MANFCSQCGSPLDVTTGQCPKCAPKVYPNFCALCGSPIEPLTGVCPGCGALAEPLPAPAAPVPEVISAPAAPVSAPEPAVEEKPETPAPAPVVEMIPEPVAEPEAPAASVAPEEPEVFYCDCCGHPMEPGVAACPLCGGAPTKEVASVFVFEEEFSAAEEPATEEPVAKEPEVPVEEVLEAAQEPEALSEEPPVVAEEPDEDPAEEVPAVEPVVVQKPKFCEKCGSAVDQQTGVCVVCGAVAFTVEEVVPEIPAVEEPTVELVAEKPAAAEVPAEKPAAENPVTVAIFEPAVKEASAVAHPKFCELCGTPTDPETGACPKCAPKPVAPAPEPAPVATPVAPAPAVAPAKFCERCGSPIDPVLGVCLKCSMPKTAVAPAAVAACQSTVAKPKKSKALTVVLAIFLSILVFIFGVACVTALTARQAVSASGAATVMNRVDLPEVLNMAFDVGDAGDDFYEPIIEFLAEEHGIEVTEKELDAVLKKSTLNAFLAEKIETYGTDLVKGNNKFTVTKQEVADLLMEDENREIIEEEFGRSVPDEAMESIAQWLINEESIESLSVESIRKENNVLVSLLSFFLSYPAIILMAVLAVLFGAIILLRDPSAGVLANGITLTVIGSLFGLLFLGSLVLPMISSFDGILGIALAVGSGVLMSSAVVYACVFGAGVLALIIRKIVLVIRNRKTA